MENIEAETIKLSNLLKYIKFKLESKTQIRFKFYNNNSKPNIIYLLIIWLEYFN